MKNFLKSLTIFILSFFLLHSFLFTSFANTWKQDNQGWKLYNEKNEAITGWVQSNNN